MLTLDGNHNKCYLPAIQFCTGLKNPVSIEMKGLLRDVGAKQLNTALEKKGLVLVHQKYIEKNANGNCGPMYLELLSKTAGTFMLGGKVDGHLHWAGLDCFRGAMYMGNGFARILQPEDLKSREAAKRFFEDGGFSDVREVHCVRKLPGKRKYAP